MLQSPIPTWTRGVPAHQEYFTFTNNAWHPVEVTGPTEPRDNGTPQPFQFSVLSWNIDFMRPMPHARMAGALKHLHSLVDGQPNRHVIMLNEMVVSDLDLIRHTDWVRTGYNITDVSNFHWESPGYGTCMLIPRSLPIQSVFRVHYPDTAMQRDALFVDVSLPGSRTLRLCSTHLESLAPNPPKRPSQLALAASYLHQPAAATTATTTIVGGVLAGDLNAVQDFDRTLPEENGLRDAYLECGGVEGTEEGMTWGQMAHRDQRERFGLSRMDKVLFCGEGLEVVGFERFGMDVLVDGGEAIERQLVMMTGLERPWVTDHLGVKADFRLAVPQEGGGEGQGGGS
ncbi:hypothetical protein VTK26DRAFT_3046 [Humicola hyalothermophila]